MNTCSTAQEGASPRPAAAHRRQPKRFDEALTGRARCLSDVACGFTAICCCARRSWIPARREDVLEADGVFSVIDQDRLWASGTIRQLPDEDAIPPGAGSGGCRSAAGLLAQVTFALIALALTGLLGCHQSITTVSGPIPQRGYLWQRAWNPAVMAAVQEAGKHLDGLVVIGAEILWNGSTPETIRANIDWPTLEHAAKPIALALRIAPYPGPFSKEDFTAKYISDVAKSLIADAAAHRLNVSEFQLDFDCAQKKLNGYRLWVQTVRTAVYPTRFVITTLPAWLKEPDFVPLVRLADSYVLQVHSVPVSTQGGQSILLDTNLARQWTKTAAGLGIPFSVALPTYRCLAGYDTTGKLLGVAMDSIDLAWPPGTRTLEFSTDADDTAKLVNEWLSARPAELKELIWYRIPVATDQRNWRWPTLAAVMTGRKPIHKLQSIQRGNNPVDLSIKNIGEADKQVAVKLTVRWTDASLVAYDALPGWTVATEKDRAVFTRKEDIPTGLPPGGEHSVGWLRFDNVVNSVSVAEEFSAPRH